MLTKSNTTSHNLKAIKSSIRRCRMNEEAKIRRLRRILASGTAVVAMATPVTATTPRMAVPVLVTKMEKPRTTLVAVHPKTAALAFEDVDPRVVKNYARPKPIHNLIRPRSN